MLTRCAYDGVAVGEENVPLKVKTGKGWTTLELEKSNNIRSHITKKNSTRVHSRSQLLYD